MLLASVIETLAQQQPQTTTAQCSCRIGRTGVVGVIATSRSTACVAIRELGTAAAPQIAGRASECAARQSGARRSSMRALMLLFAARGARALRAPALRSTARSLVARRAAYDVAQVEEKWQKFWDDDKTFRSERNAGKDKKYILDMFPYPSGSGLHVGHPEGYTATDIMARYWRMKGFDVLHPMGWDAFGLPAEQHAINTGTHPRETTLKNIGTFKRQLKALGLSYDWDRELSTTDPDYVKWTQWIFLQLFEAGLAQQKEVPVNWCDLRVLKCCGAFTPSTRVVSRRGGRGWFLCRI